MMKTRALIWPGYAAAALLIAMPLLDTLLSVWPLRPGEVSWRFGAVGLFSRALMTPLLGLLLMFAISLLFDHRRVTRTIAVAAGASILVIGGAMLLFVLDALQMRAQVRPEAMRAFDVATIVAFAKYGFAIITALGFAIPGWKASRPLDRGAPEPGKLVVGRSAGAPAGVR
jgi:hypothetical protein